MKQNFTFETPLEEVKKLNKNHKAALERLGLTTVKDAVFYYPYRYDDFSTITPINEIRINEVNTIHGTIEEIYNEETRKRYLTITKAVIKDKTGSLEAIWFRQPYIEKFLQPGTEVTLSGKVEHGFTGSLQIKTPVYEIIKKNGIYTGRIVPIYSETSGITSKWLRGLIKPLLTTAKGLKDPLPKKIREKYNLFPIYEALRNIHFPENVEMLEKGKIRISFEEMLLLQLMNKKKYLTFQKVKAYTIPYKNDITTDFLKTLPFELTNDQKRASWSIFQDLEKNLPMNRLLEGDVGSGKTLVATLALLHTAKQGFQGMLLAPTEILSKQHFNTVSSLFKNEKDIIIALLTRSQSHISDLGDVPKKEIEEKLQNGTINIAIGTHTLLGKDIHTKNCALAIIDEQHRFGVKQRAKLKKCNIDDISPHFLSMTATPIPRTLALSVYGDLDLSIIKEMPKHRKKIQTHLTSPQKRDQAYEYIREKITEGDQVFVVCPLVEESDKLGVKSATEEYEKLNTHIFPEITIGLLHGKLKKDLKTDIMKRFTDGEIKILVCTSVIEVGIDVPNATIMMIEGSERFGLAQLHQFRGRVGRGEKQSYCFLFTENMNDKSYERLSALTTMHSGFDLAQKDLETRGPGEVYGVRQSGLPDLKMASLIDFELVEKTRTAADILLKSDPDLKKHPHLKKALKAFESTVHFE